MAAGFEEALRQRLGESAHLTAVADPRQLDAHVRALETADVIVGWPLTNEVVDRAPNVRLVQASGIGVDGLDLDRLRPGVMAANTHHHESAIAEWVLLAMLWLARWPARYDRLLREGNWTGSCIWGERPMLRDLRGQTALLIGIGNIAREIAPRAAAFGVRVIGVSRTPEPRPGFDEVTGWDSWMDRVGEADYVVPCCPLVPETRGLIGEAVLARMKPEACVINMTRGPVVDERALYQALREGRIAGAAIDTWYRYPVGEQERVLPAAMPFHELPNVLLSPHISGWTQSTVDGRVADIAENIRRLAEGREILNRLR
jgi:phosphoglycerate dehydrogenase-like enzyme